MKPLLFPVIHRIRQQLFAERNEHGQIMGCGLLQDEIDDRDFKLGIFGIGEYKPKNQRVVVPTISVKNQQQFNTCVLNSATVQKELDEKIKLSVRSLVLFAMSQGYIQGNGYSGLRDIQKCVQDFGIAAEDSLNGGSIPEWEVYSDTQNLTDSVKTSASQHRSKTFWSATPRNDTLKALDEGKILHTGMPWYSGFNMGGGFSAPWLITENKGYLVGGHAFVIKGYDLNYCGKKVYICQNSYGLNWGDKGDFYIEMDYFDKVSYERYVQMDMSIEVAKIVANYQGQFVKDMGSSAIYFITKNTRMPFPDMDTFLAFGGRSKGYTEINHEALELIPIGQTMDITQSDYWPYIKDLDKSQWRDALILLISKR